MMTDGVIEEIKRQVRELANRLESEVRERHRITAQNNESARCARDELDL
ncbi:MAG: hypothetical protein GY820_15605, partial [Gammaproteobacteria bacterium]|nr:hypothetical protein [Gammaproteobacteria bacterium]